MFPRMASQVGTCCHSPVENADRKISCQTLGARHLAMGRRGEGEQEKSWLNGRTEREKIKSCPHPSRQHSSLTRLWHWSQPGRELAVRSQALGAPWGRRCFVSRPAWCEGTFFNHFAYDSIFQLHGVSRLLVSRRNKQKKSPNQRVTESCVCSVRIWRVFYSRFILPDRTVSEEIARSFSCSIQPGVFTFVLKQMAK